MQIRFDSDDSLPLNKKVEIPVMTRFAGASFYENNKYFR